ncbi:hypothetical protein PT974_10930 [Cladobotryum mycophilum]|uniref:PA14 domain-containing protein n=1 Tax=Cladobotryum mycophilum TaxID=491253 RepID=A0ABR0SB66_9HYPO
MAAPGGVDFCKLNPVVIGLLKHYPAATPYCSSFLGITTKTVTSYKTKYPPDVTATRVVSLTGDPIVATVSATQTIVVDSTPTVTKYQTVTDYITVTTTDTLSCLNKAYTAPAEVTVVVKRGYPAPKPTCIPKGWANGAISNACKCLSLPTPTVTDYKYKTADAVTKTSFSTTTIRPLITTTATVQKTQTNVGATKTITLRKTVTVTKNVAATEIATNDLSYRRYTHTYNANLASPGFTSSFFKNAVPVASGKLANLAFISPNWPSGSSILTFPSTPAFDSAQSAIVFHGFFLAKESGQYTFSSNAATVDNWESIWLGDVAFSDWNDSNAGFKAQRIGSGTQGGTTTITLTKGSAIPITYLWANGGGPARSDLTVTTPGGTKVEGGVGYWVNVCNPDDIFP